MTVAMKQRGLPFAALALILLGAAPNMLMAESAAAPGPATQAAPAAPVAPGTTTLAAEAAGPAPAAPTWSPWTFDFILRLIGLDIGVGYRGWSLLPGVQTTFWVYGGGGWEGEHYYRTPTGSFLGPSSIGSESEASFNRWEGAWRLGVEQGFLWNPRTSTNLLESFFFYRGRYDVNQGLSALASSPSPSVLPDRDGSFLNTLQLGLAYDDLLTSSHRTRDGVLVETTTEWGPPWLFNTIQGSSDFVRFNGQLSWFVKLYDAEPDRRHNLFSVYAGEFLNADYAIGLNGSQVPLYVRQTFGGRTQDTALGAQVRGVDKGAYDANLKAVSNLEIRFNLPAIPADDIATALLPAGLASLVPDVVPGLLVYLDAGAYDQVGEPGISSPPSGLVAATGGGAYVDVPGLGFVLLYLEYRLDAPNAEGDRLRLALEFGAQF